MLENKQIVINTDLDGILSALIMCHYLNCEVVGFYNSKDKLVLKKGTKKDNPVYVDIFTQNPNIVNIDQHIVSYDENHHNYLLNLGTKINPNLDNGKYFTSFYYEKYPFGTVHYLISLLESKGVDVQLDLNKKYGYISMADILFRADDTLNTTLHRYVDNSKNWWNWLLEKSNHSNITNHMYEKIYSISKDEITHRTKLCEDMFNHFNCETKDGGYRYITDYNYKVKKDFKSYVQFLSKFFNLKCFNMDMDFDVYVGKNVRTTLFDYQVEDFKKGYLGTNEIFSYAFVKSSLYYDSLSYTTKLEKLDLN